MRINTTVLVGCACVALFAFAGRPLVNAQSAAPLRLSTSASLEGTLLAALVFADADTNNDGVLTRDELKAAVDKWWTSAAGSKASAVTREDLVPVLNAAMSTQSLTALFNMGGGGAQPQTPDPLTERAMMAALPASAPATPARPRKVLVLGHAAGFVHSSIPLAAATIKALGAKTGAWTTTITYDPADINTANLQQYDAVFLASTTGAFLDDPSNAGVTAARRQALLDFVRRGKGLAGIHAATDSYHAAAPGPAPAPGLAGAGRSAARGAAANPLGNFSAGSALAPVMLSQGDRNHDQKLDKAEADALADAWFQALDTKRSGRLDKTDFAFFALLIPKASGADAAPVPQGPDNQVGTWPEFNTMIGGYFKFHWIDPQLITVKIDDPKSPLTAMFHGQEFQVHDETYTMGAHSWSRANVHVLTSIDYDKMSAEDKAQESNPRADHDYGLSWIRREGQGRVFYEAHGHSERIYAMRPMLEHLLAGVQYAIGDLKADDTPSAR